MNPLHITSACLAIQIPDQFLIFVSNYYLCMHDDLYIKICHYMNGFEFTEYVWLIWWNRES